MEISVGNIVNLFFVLVSLITFFCIITRLIACIYGKEKTVDAIIVDKKCCKKRIYRKSEAPFLKKEYIAVFLSVPKEKRLCFKISENTYKSCALNQKGSLTYKGNRVIDFKIK